MILAWHHRAIKVHAPAPAGGARQPTRRRRTSLAFGPHAGETLGQVAQADPTYLRTLALSARRPDVRAAARHIVTLLPDAWIKRRRHEPQQ